MPNRNLEEFIDNVEHQIKKERVLCRLFEDSHLMRAIFNPDGTFFNVNKKWVEVLGYSKEEFRNKPFKDFIAEEDVEDSMNVYNNRQFNIAGQEDRSTYYDEDYYNHYVSKTGEKILLRWTRDFEDINGMLVSTCVPVKVQ